MVNRLINKFLLRVKLRKDPREVKVHPSLDAALRGKVIEWQFEAGGKDYYKMANDYEMPVMRFRFAKKFYEEVINRVTHDELKKACSLLKEYLNGGKEGVVKIGEAYKVIDDLEYQLSWAFEPESLLRWASVLYFDLEEDITDYDQRYNGLKIESFKKKGVFTLLVKRLMSGSEVLSSLSEEDLKTYLTEMWEAKESLSFTRDGGKDNVSRRARTTRTFSTLREMKN